MTSRYPDHCLFGGAGHAEIRSPMAAFGGGRSISTRVDSGADPIGLLRHAAAGA
jgi:hypothetical protein